MSDEPIETGDLRFSESEAAYVIISPYDYLILTLCAYVNGAVRLLELDAEFTVSNRRLACRVNQSIAQET